MSEDSEWVSKSQLKRDADAVLQLVKNLLELTSAELAEMPLSDAIMQGLIDAKKMPQSGAYKRHIKWMAKQLRNDQLPSIEASYANIIQTRQGETAEFHLIEQWRTRLIDEDNQALSEFIDKFEPNDIQQLRQIVRQAKKESSANKNLGAKRALFRLLKAIIQ